MGPNNYILNIKSPFEQAMLAYGAGRNDINQRQVMDEREQSMQLRAAQEERQQQQFESQQADAAQRRAKAKAMQDSLMQMRQMAKDGTLGVEDLNEFALANANTFDEFSAAFKNMSLPQQQEQQQFSIQTTNALLNKKPDVALKMIDERRAAAEVSGDKDTAKKMETLIAQIQMDPDGFAVATLASMRAQGIITEDVAKLMLEGGGQNKKDAVSTIGKISQDVDYGWIPKSVLDSAILIEQKNAQGGLTLQQQMAEEGRLRGEYSTRIESLTSAELNFQTISVSAEDNTGAGDIALVTSFMKMLDPGSVVRETEFATAANSGGLLAKLSSMTSKIEKGQFLSTQQRLDFKNLAAKYLDAAKKQESKVQDTYKGIVQNYGLNPANVFGVRYTQPNTQPGAQPGAQAGAQAGATDGSIDFSTMSEADLVNVNVMTLTPDQQKAMMNRFQELKAGQ